MKEQNNKPVFTIPNILSFFRLCLIPVIMYLYIGLSEYLWAAIVIAVSAITDKLDGTIARKYNQVSDLGKILDPFADKMTQGAMILCLYSRFPLMKYLIILFVIKELCQAVLGYISVRRSNVVPSSKWFGKAATVCMYSVCMILIAIPQIPDDVATVLMAVSGLFLINSLVNYCFFFIKGISN